LNLMFKTLIRLSLITSLLKNVYKYPLLITLIREEHERE